jgi:hypothetical protein
MNSREKGKRGERQWRDELRANGYAARRGQQFSGSPDSPDVVCDHLPWIHFEVKAVEQLRIYDAMDQARRECGGKVPIVAHKKNFRLWLVTMEAETFFRFLRGELPPSEVTTENWLTAEMRRRGGYQPDSTPHPDPLPVRGGEGEPRDVAG